MSRLSTIVSTMDAMMLNTQPDVRIRTGKSLSRMAFPTLGQAGGCGGDPEYIIVSRESGPSTA
jgi:hypothetical protein